MTTNDAQDLRSELVAGIGDQPHRSSRMPSVIGSPLPLRPHHAGRQRAAKKAMASDYQRWVETTLAYLNTDLGSHDWRP